MNEIGMMRSRIDAGNSLFGIHHWYAIGKESEEMREGEVLIGRNGCLVRRKNDRKTADLRQRAGSPEGEEGKAERERERDRHAKVGSK